MTLKCKNDYDFTVKRNLRYFLKDSYGNIKSSNLHKPQLSNSLDLL